MKSAIRIGPVSGEVDPQITGGSEGSRGDDVSSPAVRLDLVAKSVHKTKTYIHKILFPLEFESSW